MTFRPRKWLLYAPVAILPFLAALVLNGSAVLEDVAVRAQNSLFAAKADWAKLTFDGRDARLTGEAPNDEAADAAVAAVAATYGVRRVEGIIRVVPPPPKVELRQPTVDKVTAEASGLQVKGTWHEGHAVSLKARLADKTWSLGEGEALTSDGQGHWSLTPGLDLEPGTYDLVVETADAEGKVSRDSATDDIVILPPPPDLGLPTVESVESASSTPVIRGTWPSTVARDLAVSIGTTAFVLGKAGELVASGDDWTLTPSTPLADGTFDLSVEVQDERGRVARTATPGRLLVDTQPPATPVVGPVVIEGEGITVGGTWPEGDAISLVAKLADRIWTLGKDGALSSDGKGNWRFAPDVKLAPGAYDLAIEVADRLGNVAADSTRNEIVIAAPPPPPPPEMTAPSVVPAVETMARPVVRGTWSEIAATALAVAVAGQRYELGRDAALASDGIGNWSLSLPAPLADGVYDVVVESRDAKGEVLTDSTVGELVIDARGPASPTVAFYAGEGSPERISGTWDWENASSLSIAVPVLGWTARLGTDGDLTSAAGAWALRVASPMPPGSYDVEVIATDSRGRVARDQTRFEVLVREPLPPITPPTVLYYSGEGLPKDLRGGWDEGEATTLAVSIPAAGIAATLGTGDTLTSDGAGHWTLLLPQDLAPGRYDVAVATSDGGSRTATETFAGA
ncbi:MAG: hypothetical protein KDK89_05890, partial [Alphaproteobacteria bacterium]|nr:hypothetical protein [Alphaproteobacteria bacterium]